MQSLYLVALLPPEPIFTHVWDLKQEVHRLTGSRNAVRLPPHITLLPPMREADDFEGLCTTALAAFAQTESAFSVGVADFAWFGDRTLFVHVSEAAALKAFHARLLAWCATQLPQVRPEGRPYTPHMTLATRDLPRHQVPELRQLFASRTYRATFPVTGFTLFRHNGQQWQPRATFALSATGSPA